MFKAIGTVVASIAIVIGSTLALGHGSKGFTEEESALIASLSLDSLEPLPADPSNRFAESPEAAALGKDLFFDKRFSSNGQVSCATCHLPDRQFQDDVDRANGVGLTNRRTMPIAGTAYSPWMFWDGRKDSQWSQALGPLESPVEHGGKRGDYATLMARAYNEQYRRAFGSAVDFGDTTRVFVNIGKAIAAFERTIPIPRTRFDEFVETGRGFTDDEVAGLRLFVGKANCTQCHNGALLTDNVFHNTGVPARADLPRDVGRALGATQVLADEFNCKSRWSDARREECAELNFLAADGHELMRAYKTPSLRGVAGRPPYMHAGQLKNLDAVLDHYNRAPAAPDGHSELRPLRLSANEMTQLKAYLETL